jgi:hypothetical protein
MGEAFLNIFATDFVGSCPYASSAKLLNCVISEKGFSLGYREVIFFETDESSQTRGCRDADEPAGFIRMSSREGFGWFGGIGGLRIRLCWSGVWSGTDSVGISKPYSRASAAQIAC